MSYYRKLGVFARIPAAGRVKSRLVPPLSERDAYELYRAFVADFFRRLERLKKVDTTVFFTGGDDPADLQALAPQRFGFVQQRGETLGDRMAHAFETMIEDEGTIAVVVGSDSPDLPLTYIKRALLKLKHRDVVLGPASDGGYYLIGLKRPRPVLFSGPAWGTDTVLESTLGIVRDKGLSCSLLPVWYDVDDAQSLALLRNLVMARRIENQNGLRETERVMRSIFPDDESTS